MGECLSLFLLLLRCASPAGLGRGRLSLTPAPLRRGSLFLPIPVHDPRTLAQRDLRFWPSSDGRPIGCDCRFEIIDAGDVLDDVVTRTIPNIDAECEVGLRLHVAPRE
jgi:hypothetical protein